LIFNAPGFATVRLLSRKLIFDAATSVVVIVSSHPIFLLVQHRRALLTSCAYIRAFFHPNLLFAWDFPLRRFGGFSDCAHRLNGSPG
jgi:hypothetical protein